MTRRSTLSSRATRTESISASPTRLSPIPTITPTSLLDVYLFIEDADALYDEYVAGGVEFTRPLGDTAGTRANSS
jgi:hypothetical protein